MRVSRRDTTLPIEVGDGGKPRREETAMTANPVPLRRAAPPRPLLFLDFEASGLTPGSWPIEIGCAWIAAGGAVEVSATLIAPRPEWPPAEWSDGAARLHGIPRDALAAATPADAVAAGTDGFAAFDVVSDNPAWDGLWLDRLRGDRPRIPVLGLRGEVARRLTPRAADDFVRRCLRAPALHRAGPDAERLARAWAAAADGFGLAA